MSPNKVRNRINRRKFVKLTAALTSAFLFPQRVAAQQKTLKIVQWSHFVPGYDKWFDGTFTKEWGRKHNTNVIVDHIATSEINARAAAEVAARKGHDLFMFISPPAAYEKHVIDHSEIYQEVERRHGKKIALAERSTYNPKTKKHFAFSDSYVPDPGNYRKDLWSQAGFPNGPDTYNDLLTGGRRIKEKFGNPVGLGLSQEVDTSMAVRAVLWSFGGAEQDEAGNVTLHSKNTIEAVKYVRALYKQCETPEVFSWDVSSNNRGILSGKLSFVQNAISVTRSAEKDNPEMSRQIQLTPALKGPVRRIAAEHVMDCYVVWNFAENKEGAKQFLVDLIDNFSRAFNASEFYNFPCFPATVPDLDKRLADDPKARPRDKYKVLSGVLNWTTNIGYPGYATAAIDEAYNTFVLPTMFAKAARDEMTPEAAVRAADRELKRIFEKWK
ncbi:MAG TPA: extracellular solute-binding protein [Thermoanaerobaculia bacterium]|jgi:multiple sugar transport system substrate-binding protein|nr:extracellular solute-binding protein [Thermoanaerobaculia bacterium]